MREALELASEEAARLLVDQWGFSPDEAFIFLSVACDLGHRAVLPAITVLGDRARHDPQDLGLPAALRRADFVPGTILFALTGVSANIT